MKVFATVQLSWLVRWPMPIRSHGPHACVFQLFALDQATAQPASFTLDDLIAAIKGHVLGRARLEGTYEIR